MNIGYAGQKTNSNTVGENRMTHDVGTIRLEDIPDLSGFDQAPSQEPFSNGWYKGRVLAKRTFTDKNGNDREFASTDAPSQKGDSRNIRLQVEITRKSDGRTLNTSVMVNYNPDDLSQSTVQKIAAQAELNKTQGEDWGTLFRPYMSLLRLSALQKIAGVRQLQRTQDGGLDISPLYGKTAWFRLKDDDRNPQYKAVDKFQENEPKRVPTL